MDDALTTLRSLRETFNAEQSARREPADAYVSVALTADGTVYVTASGADWEAEGQGATLGAAAAVALADYRRGWEVAA